MNDIKKTLREIISNKYYILTVVALTLILLLAILLHSCTEEPDETISSSGDSSIDSSVTTSSTDDGTAHVLELMDADIRNDDSVVAAVVFDVNTFGEYSEIIERSGLYRFTAVNVDGTETSVYWDIYVFDEPYKYGTNHMIENETPSATTDGSVTLYKGQYLYCICSVNQYNYQNTDILAYLKIRFANEVDDSLHTSHEHDYQEATRVENCESPGYIIYECSCGDSYIETLEPTGHDYEETETEPTCTEDGFITYKCKKCDDTYDEPSGKKATGHVFDSTSSHVTPQRHEFTCSSCGENVSENHTFTATAMITAMTDSSGSIRYYAIAMRNICSVCNYSASIDTPDVTHRTSSYQYDRSSETLTFVCDDCGSRTYHCTVYLDYEVITESEPSSSSNSGAGANSSH